LLAKNVLIWIYEIKIFQNHPKAIESHYKKSGFWTYRMNLIKNHPEILNFLGHITKKEPKKSKSVVLVPVWLLILDFLARNRVKKSKMGILFLNCRQRRSCNFFSLMGLGGQKVKRVHAAELHEPF